MDKERVQAFAASNALLMDNVRYDDADFSTPEMQQMISESEGQYSTLGGVVSFVVNGHYYATPFVNEALKILKESGFKNNMGIHVPFSNFESFPGKLGPNSEKRMWAGAYYPESQTFEPARKIVEYYREVQRVHGGYRRWKELLDMSGALGTLENGRKITLDDNLDLMLQDIWNHKEEYRAMAAQELGIYGDLYSTEETKRSSRR